MQTFEVDLTSGKDRSAAKLLLQALVLTAIWMGVNLVLKMIWPNSRSLSHELLSALLWGIVMTALSNSSNVPLEKRFTLTLDNCTLSASNHLGQKRTVHKGKVKTVYQARDLLCRPTGLVASDRGAAATWFLGGVYVPKTLPEYDQIKAMLLDWKSSGL